MQTEHTDTEAELAAAVRKAAEGLDLSDPAIAELHEAGKSRLADKRLNRELEHLIDGERTPDYSEHGYSGAELVAKLADAETIPHLIEDLTTEGSTTLLVAPTNAGGSTFLDNLAVSYLTGRPFLGALAVQPAPYRVLHINPEEELTAPAERIVASGVDLGSEEISDHYYGLHTRDDRLYFNRPAMVDSVIQTLEGIGWDDDSRPLIVIVDGVQPTLSGESWGADLERWKEGIGQFRLAVKPAALYVRTQITSAAARYSRKAKKEGAGQIAGEDATGGQIFQWPDIRLTINRSGEDRLLNVRGRRIFRAGRRVESWDAIYGYDPATFGLTLIGQDQTTAATVRIMEVFRADEWLKADRSTSIRGVADYLHEKDLRHEDGDPNYAVVSAITYRRSLEGWTYNPSTETWKPPNGVKTT